MLLNQTDKNSIAIVILISVCQVYILYTIHLLKALMFPPSKDALFKWLLLNNECFPFSFLCILVISEWLWVFSIFLSPWRRSCPFSQPEKKNELTSVFIILSPIQISSLIHFHPHIVLPSYWHLLLLTFNLGTTQFALWRRHLFLP